MANRVANTAIVCEDHADPGFFEAEADGDGLIDGEGVGEALVA